MQFQLKNYKSMLYPHKWKVNLSISESGKSGNGKGKNRESPIITAGSRPSAISEKLVSLMWGMHHTVIMVSAGISGHVFVNRCKCWGACLPAKAGGGIARKTTETGMFYDRLLGNVLISFNLKT
jgi:hypothetical protein